MVCLGVQEEKESLSSEHVCLISCQYDCTKSSYNDLKLSNNIVTTRYFIMRPLTPQKGLLIETQPKEVTIAIYTSSTIVIPTAWPKLYESRQYQHLNIYTPFASENPKVFAQ